MANQSHDRGEPSFSGDASLRHPGPVGEPEYIYFIRAGGAQQIKIGWAKDAYKRLAQLQTGCPHQLQLIGFAPGTLEIESRWHQRWHPLRLRGEWFKLNDDLRHEINRFLLTPGATRLILMKISWVVRKRQARAHARLADKIAGLNLEINHEPNRS